MSYIDMCRASDPRHIAHQVQFQFRLEDSAFSQHLHAPHHLQLPHARTAISTHTLLRTTIGNHTRPSAITQ